jgi:glycine/D-amino acid oxidase-like deaminating enzyme
MSEFDHEIVIVGLGPTGLTLANMLGRRGIDVLVLEREPEYYGLARAVYTDDECMRIFQAADVADLINAEMNLDSTVQWVRGDGKVLAQAFAFGAAGWIELLGCREKLAQTPGLRPVLTRPAGAFRFPGRTIGMLREAGADSQCRPRRRGSPAALGLSTSAR